MALWMFIAGAILIVLIFFYYYNRFVSLSQQIDNSLAQINVQLKKRADLVPNLISTVKGYMTHEKKVMDSVTEARKVFASAKGMEGKMKAGNKLQEALRSIFAIAENYPQLRANENFLHLQQELASIEDRVAYARQFYNDGIMVYNVMVSSVPGSWFAKLYGYKAQTYFKIEEAEKATPKVSF